jgi:transcriptional regulator with XRE-family HTH domain
MIKTTRTVEVKITYHGSHLVAAREELGLTQAQLAELAGLKQQQISQLERPHPVTIYSATALSLARAGIVFEGQT